MAACCCGRGRPRMSPISSISDANSGRVEASLPKVTAPCPSLHRKLRHDDVGVDAGLWIEPIDFSDVLLTLPPFRVAPRFYVPDVGNGLLNCRYRFAFEQN